MITLKEIAERTLKDHLYYRQHGYPDTFAATITHFDRLYLLQFIDQLGQELGVDLSESWATPRPRMTPIEKRMADALDKAGIDYLPPPGLS